MKKIISLFLFGNISACFATNDSFLTAQQFPKTFEDLSFKSRIEVLRDGYAPYDMVYDDNGVCVSGCAYRGITLKETMVAVDEANDEITELIEQEYAQNPVLSTDLDYFGPATDWCRNGLSTKLPLRYPVNMTNLKYKITSDFGLRPKSKNGRGFHPALDIGTPDGTPVYATADGVVIEVANQTSRGGGGKYISIKHDKGLITQYLHLQEQLVYKGQRVKACDKIALSGHSGISVDGTPYDPHLDYRIRFDSNRDKFIDILCPCKAAYKNKKQGGVTSMSELSGCAHSLFNAPYKFSPYSSNSDETKRSLWRAEWGHCMTNRTDLLPDEVR